MFGTATCSRLISDSSFLLVPKETGAGKLTERLNLSKEIITRYDKDKSGKLTRDEYEGFGGVRSAMGGFVKQHAQEIDADDDGIITKNELTGMAIRMFDKADANRDTKLMADELVLPAGYKPTPPDGAELPANRKESRKP